MKRAATLRPVAILLALSVLVLGAAAPHAACGGACCGADKAAASAWAGGTQGFEAPHACCCGPGAKPCDLEQAPDKDLPDSAVASVPRLEPPAPAAFVPSPEPGVPAPLGGRSVAVLSPSAQGPPGPLYLRTQAFLC